MLSQFALSRVHRTGLPSAFHGAAAARTRRIRRIEVSFAHEVAEGPVIFSLLRAADAHNPGSLGHAVRVCRLACKIADVCGVAAHAIETVTEAALLHDIGKVVVPARVLRKPGMLTGAERETVRLHASAGARLVSAIPRLQRASILIQTSHEWVNGGGYPSGLCGDAIPLGSRIIAVADAFDVLTHARTYSTALDAPRALQELQRGVGEQFDPRVVAALEQVLRASPHGAARSLQRPPAHGPHAV